MTTQLKCVNCSDAVENFVKMLDYFASSLCFDIKTYEVAADELWQTFNVVSGAHCSVVAQQQSGRFHRRNAW
jgi:hypothetical protein